MSVLEDVEALVERQYRESRDRDAPYIDWRWGIENEVSEKLGRMEEDEGMTENEAMACLLEWTEGGETLLHLGELGIAYAIEVLRDWN